MTAAGGRDHQFLVRHGSYLRQVKIGIPPEGNVAGTCSVCGAPVDAPFESCAPCNQHKRWLQARDRAYPVDAISFLTYAVKGPEQIYVADQPSVTLGWEGRVGRQAYRVLADYKANPPALEAFQALAEWLDWWLVKWGPFRPSTTLSELLWIVPPSRRSNRTGDHPLSIIVSHVLERQGRSARQVTMVGNSQRTQRDLSEDAYSVPEDLTGKTVLIVEDAWVTGSNVVNTALALKAAGADSVYAMVLGRVLEAKWGPNQTFKQQGGLKNSLTIDALQKSPWSWLDPPHSQRPR